MGNCGDCKFWMKPSERTDFTSAVTFDWTPEVLSFEQYEKESDEADKKFGKCLQIKMGTDLYLSEPIPLAVTRDGSEYMADLFTQAEFGCVEYRSV